MTQWYCPPPKWKVGCSIHGHWVDRRSAPGQQRSPQPPRQKALFKLRPAANIHKTNPLHFMRSIKKLYPKEKANSKKMTKTRSGLMPYITVWCHAIQWILVYPTRRRLLFLGLMVTNCSGKMLFSRVKKFKMNERVAMHQERLPSLSICCIRSDKLGQTNFNEFLHDFMKARKKPCLLGSVEPYWIRRL